MATQLFLLSTAADTHRGTNTAKRDGTASGWLAKALATTRGSGVTASGNTATVTGATNGVEVTHSSGIPFEWLSPPVSADVTISGTITANIWASETNMSANVAINVIIDIVRSATSGADASNTIVNIVQSTYAAAEVAVTTRAANNFTAGMTSGGYTGQTLNRGDRLRIRIVGDDFGTMATGYTFNASWAGTSAAADGDTYVTFTENFSFESAPAGSVLYLTNTHPGLSGAPALISDFTGSENPLSEGGNWANLNSSGSPLQKSSNVARATAATLCRSYWTPANFGPDLEAYVSVSLGSHNGGIVFRVQGEGGAGTWDGYEITARSSNVDFSVVTNAALTTTTFSGATWGVGDKLGIRAEGSTFQAWRQASGSGTWNLYATWVDTTYSSAGKIGLMLNTTTPGWDAFYAATDSNLFTQKAWTSRGAGAVSYLSDTDAGWTAPLYTHDWYTPELTAFTLTGMAVGNLRLHSSIANNVSARLELSRVNSDGSSPTVWASWCITTSNLDGAISDTETAQTANVSGDDLAISDGQRLRIRVYVEDSSDAALVASQTLTLTYAGTSGGASGDSYVTLAQSVSEYVTATAGSAMQTRRQRRASRYLTHR